MGNIITVRFRKSSTTASGVLGASNDGFVGGIVAPFFPTHERVSLALMKQRTRILERTEIGVDVNGASFVSYNRSRPYTYYTPTFGTKSEKAAQRQRDRIHRLLGGKGQRVGTKGIKFASYAAFKEAFGIGVVNLMGIDPPFMLSQIEMRQDGESFNIRGFGPAKGVYTIGIYGKKGVIAASHNRGLGRQPQRTFFALSASDIEDILADISGKNPD